MSARYLTKRNDTVDWICWKHYGTSRGTTEAVLEANPGLAAHGSKLPPGLTITLPDIEPPKEDEPIRLWE